MHLLIIHYAIMHALSAYPANARAYAATTSSSLTFADNLVYYTNAGPMAGGVTAASQYQLTHTVL